MFQLPMNVDTRKALKPLHKLRKLLEDFPAHPLPEEVHDLRTCARHIEALVHMVSPDSDHDARHLLKLIKPVRKAAGRVRDLDVFIAKLHEVRADSENESLVLLTEHIAIRRDKQLVRLHRAIERRRKQTRRSIHRYARSLESGEEVANPAAAETLAERLDNWPGLRAGNLHEFRIHAKELRYMLQLVPGFDQERINALGEVKDLAGEWHDWLELHSLAKDVLDPAEGQQTLHQIAAITRDKLRASLAAANRLRRADIEIPRAA